MFGWEEQLDLPLDFYTHCPPSKYTYIYDIFLWEALHDFRPTFGNSDDVLVHASNQGDMARL